MRGVQRSKITNIKKKKKKKSDFLRLFYHLSTGWAEKERLGVRRPSENPGQ